MKKTSMLWKVLIAIGLAMIVGWLTGPNASIWGIPCYHLFDLFGTLFLNALTLLVVPLVSSSIIYGLGQMRGEQSFGRLGTKTFFFYILTTLMAVLVGVILVNLIAPGSQYSPPQLENTASDTPSVQLPENNIDLLSMILTKVIPSNIVAAASQGNMLGIIFFSLLFGIALCKIESEASNAILNCIKGIFHALMRMTHFVMKAMPIGVFFLVAKVVATTGFGSITSLLYFFITVLLGLLVFVFIALPILLKMNGIHPLRHIRAIGPALVTAFSTSSSAATLPITMECVEKRAGVSNRISSFVIPLGTSMNMAGSALYECVAALFIAQVYSVEFTFAHQVIIVFLSLLTSMGVAGVPSASLVAIIIILNTMGLPAEGLALILPIDRILDMCRTTTNVFSDATCAVLVAKTEGEQILKSNIKK